MENNQNNSNSSVSRVHILTGQFGKQIDRIEAHRVTLPPGQQAGRHVHSGGVIGYVEDGDILFQIEGQPAQELHSGSVFYEPPDVIIARFDNISDKLPATFIAFYPLAGEQALIAMLAQES